MPKERVALTKFRIRAYRSCKDTVFSLKDQFTALIGPNGAGKTNVMNAVLLLSKTSNVQFRSYARENFTDKCEVTADFTVNDKIVHYRSIINYTQTEANKDQVVSANVKWNFKSITGKSVWYQDELLKISMSSGSNFIIRSGHRIYYHGIGGRVQAHPAKSIGRISKRELGYYEHIQNFLAGMKYYSASQFTNPSLSPTFFEIDEEKGERLSENIMTRRLPHTRFVYDLYSLSKSNKKSYDNFLSLVGSQGVKIIDGINWQSIDVPSATYEVQTGGKVINKTKNRIMIIPTVVIGPSKLSFNQLSEGTLRTLAMLFYIVTDESELLLLEEPEVCVHHG
jgi:AAA15 family ATPase/GTPase